MAEPSEGAYYIVNVGNQKALDVYEQNKYTWNWIHTATLNRNDLVRGEGQLWAFDKQSNGWQLTNSFTGKCLTSYGEAANNKYGVDGWASAYSDDNKAYQRWTIATDGQTFTYGGKSYPTYTIKSKYSTMSNWPLYVVSSGSNKDFVACWNGSYGDYARWIFIPASVLTGGGTYHIVPAKNVKACLEVASGSTSDKANIRLNAQNDKPYQVFRAAVNSETFVTTLIDANSKKAIDLASSSPKAGTNVILYKRQTGSQTQGWIIEKAGNVKINGVNVPTYVIRSQASTGLAMACADKSAKMNTNITLATYNSSSTLQRFALVKTELTGSKLSVPGGITKTTMSYNPDKAAPSLSGLSFKSGEKMFQVRYKIRRYKAGTNYKQYTDTTWLNLNDSSKANNGWGSAWSKTFSATPSGGTITIPSAALKSLNKTLKSYYNIKTEGGKSVRYRAFNVTLEVRAYTTNYNKTGFYAHSNSKTTIIKVRPKPSVAISKMSLICENDTVGVSVSVSDASESKCTMLRGRLLGADGYAISSWSSASSMSLTFKLGTTLRRLPNQNEKVKFEYSYLSSDNITVSGRIAKTFTFTTISGSAINLRNTTTGSYLTVVSGTRHVSDACVMEVTDAEGTKYVQCPVYTDKNGTIKWTAAPPFNKNTKIYVFYSTGTATKVYRSSATAFVASHAFTWNWKNSTKYYSAYASIIVNSDAPPSQTRTYTTDIQFHSPSGRILPVGFASRALTVDLSIQGIAVDSDASYVAAEPIPPHCTVKDLIALAKLSGRGVHPIYRTPYGDWSQVGIESVDVSKTKLYYSEVSVNQKALED